LHVRPLRGYGFASTWCHAANTCSIGTRLHAVHLQIHEMRNITFWQHHSHELLSRQRVLILDFNNISSGMHDQRPLDADAASMTILSRNDYFGSCWSDSDATVMTSPRRRRCRCSCSDDRLLHWHSVGMLCWVEAVH